MMNGEKELNDANMIVVAVTGMRFVARAHPTADLHRLPTIVSVLQQRVLMYDRDLNVTSAQWQDVEVSRSPAETFERVPPELQKLYNLAPFAPPKEVELGFEGPVADEFPFVAYVEGNTPVPSGWICTHGVSGDRAIYGNTALRLEATEDCTFHATYCNEPPQWNRPGKLPLLKRWMTKPPEQLVVYILPSFDNITVVPSGWTCTHSTKFARRFTKTKGHATDGDVAFHAKHRDKPLAWGARTGLPIKEQWVTT